MNAKKYTRFVATALIAFVASFGVYPLPVFAADIKYRYATDPVCSRPGAPCGQMYQRLGVNGTKGLQEKMGGAGKFEIEENAFSSDGWAKGQKVPYMEKYVDGKLAGTFNDADAVEAEIKNALTQQPPKAEQDECVFLQPGLVDNQFDAPLVGNVKINNAASGYGPLGPPEGDPKVKDSPQNAALRAKGAKPIGVYYNTTATSLDKTLQNPDNKGKRGSIYMPNGDQALEFAANGKSYKHDNGVEVQAGRPYIKGQTDEKGVSVDDDCNPIQGPVPDPSKPNANPLGEWGQPGGDGGGNGGNGGGPGGGGLGGLGGGGGLAALLPLLMQGLMGGQQGQQGQGQGQNQYGAGYGNQQQNCDAQQVAPVCGTDGRTYNNQCYLQQYGQQNGVTARSTGVCPQPSTSPTPTPTPNINSIITLQHLSQSGIPSNLLDNVRNLVSSVLSSILSGAHINETVVR